MNDNVATPEKEKLTEESTVMESWTQSEKETSRKKYGCEIMVENGSWEQVNTKDCPNDARIIKYEVDGEVRYDLTRSQKSVSIFDMYWDKFGEGLKSIDFGNGTINPKLWGYKAPETKKRK
jgi:hypothetical protein